MPEISNNFITHIKTNLDGVLQMTKMFEGIMMTGDDRANQIVVSLFRGHAPYLIPNGTKIIAYFIRPDGYTVEVASDEEQPYAVVEDGKAVVTIPAIAYELPGALSIAIRMLLDPYEEQQRGYYDSETGKYFVIVDDPSITEGPNGETIQQRTATLYRNKVAIAAASCYVRMTETNSVIDPGHFIPDISEIVAKLEEIDAKEAEIISAENAREDVESARVSAELARASAESTRVSNETARASAESTRASNETARASAESTRDSNETARRNAETARASAESTRASNENARATAEAARASSESTRASAETARRNAETARASAESTRASNETARQYAIDHMAVSAVALSPTASAPTATITDVTDSGGTYKHIQFGLIKGEKGDKGDPGAGGTNVSYNSSTKTLSLTFG